MSEGAIALGQISKWKEEEEEGSNTVCVYELVQVRSGDGTRHLY